MAFGAIGLINLLAFIQEGYELFPLVFGVVGRYIIRYFMTAGALG